MRRFSSVEHECTGKITRAANRDRNHDSSLSIVTISIRKYTAVRYESRAIQNIPSSRKDIACRVED